MTSRLLSLLLALLLVPGCAVWAPDTASGILPRYSAAEGHLRFLDRLAAADAAERREIGVLLADRVDDGASADQRLRQALWFGFPDHRGHDPVAARAMLERLVDQPGGLRPGSRALAAAELRRLTVQAELERENAELRRKIRALTEIDGSLGAEEEP